MNTWTNHLRLENRSRTTGRARLLTLMALAVCACGFVASLYGAESPAQDNAAAAVEGVKTQWPGGFDRYDYVMDAQSLAVKPFGDGNAKGLARCVVVVPKKAITGKPWSWREFYPEHPSQAEMELLERGFHVVYTTAASPEQHEAWRAFITNKYGLAKKPVVMGTSRGELKAGTAKVNLTPEDTKQPVHDKVFGRVLVLEVNGERVAFVSVDLGIYTSPHLVASCKEKYGISQMVLSSSHTHSDPGGSYKAFYEEQITQAVEAAVNNMFPARISAGHRSFPQLGFNRLIVREDGHARESWFSDDHYTSENPERIPFGPVDPEVGVIKVEDLSGQPRAIIMNYACHADVVCQNYAISADYPGAAAKYVEEAFGNNLNCLFVQGGAGNIESLIISSRRTGPDDPFQTDYSTIDRVGKLLAHETIKLAKTLSPKSTNETNVRFMNDSLKFTGRYDKDAEYDIHISTLVINDDIAIATFPGEPFIQLQLEWKKKMEGFHPFLFGYTWYEGTWPNYVPDIKSAAAGGYGADIDGPKMIEVGSGEAIMNKHFENVFRLTGFMREASGPSGFVPGVRWNVTPVPRETINPQ